MDRSQDDTLAAAVHAAASDLNEATLAAARAGLRVRTHTRKLTELSDIQFITVDVARPIYPEQEATHG